MSTIDYGMMKDSRPGLPAGVSLKTKLAVPPRILVIEDNAADVFLLERALTRQRFNFELLHLVTGSDALAFIRGQGQYADATVPNLILLDLNLAKYSGEDILREIQRTARLSGVPVWVWSSSQSGRVEASLKELGILRFITKPTGLDRFMDIGRSIKDLLAARITA